MEFRWFSHHGLSEKKKKDYQVLRRCVKKPWEITGPCADPEHRLAVSLAAGCRPECLATVKIAATVFLPQSPNLYALGSMPVEPWSNSESKFNTLWILGLI